MVNSRMGGHLGSRHFVLAEILGKCGKFTSSAEIAENLK